MVLYLVLQRTETSRFVLYLVHTERKKNEL